jgi:hypothetical protein
MGVKHWMLLAGILGGFGGILAALPNWQALATPGVVGGTLVMLSSAVTAVFIEKPGAETNVDPKRFS